MYQSATWSEGVTASVLAGHVYTYTRPLLLLHVIQWKAFGCRTTLAGGWLHRAGIRAGSTLMRWRTQEAPERFDERPALRLDGVRLRGSLRAAALGRGRCGGIVGWLSSIASSRCRSRRFV